MRAKQVIAGFCVVCICVIAVLFAGCLGQSFGVVQIPAKVPADYSSTFENFDDFVGETLARYEVAGAYVGIVSADGVILSEGYGFRGAGSTGPVDENTRF